MLPADDSVPSYTITIKEGKITRLYVVMCYTCHGTFTAALPAQEMLERDLLLSGWENIRHNWYCPRCC